MAKFFIIFKKRDSLDRENYISVSILSHMSKFLKKLTLPVQCISESCTEIKIKLNF